MNPTLYRSLSAAALLAAGCAATQSHAPAGANSTANEFAGKPYVLAMGRFLAAVPQFTVRARTTDDLVMADNGPLVGPTDRTIALRRPDRMAVSLTHKSGHRETWYDGTRLVSLEVERKAYASVPAKGNVETMFESMRQGNFYMRPLSVLFDSDPGASLCAGAQRISDLGRRDLAGRPCHAVEIGRKDAVIELWIAEGEPPLLMQVSVRMLQGSEPRRVSRFEGWDLRTPIPDDRFRPRLPAGAYQIEMMDLTGLP
jgi:hypothetical protein